MREVQRSLVSQRLVALQHEAEQERLGKLGLAQRRAQSWTPIRRARERLGGLVISLGVLIAGRTPAKSRRPVGRSI